MATQRTEVAQQVSELLRTAKSGLSLSVAFLTRMDGTSQHLEVVESSGPARLMFREGATQRQATTFCQAIWDGKLPAVIPDVRKYSEAMALPAARLPRIRSYVSVPVVLSSGERYGTFCAAAGHATGHRRRGRRLLLAAPHRADPTGRDQDRPQSVHGLADEQVLRTLVESLTTFAHGVGATVVAEGAERIEDVQALLDCRVDLGQGWYYGRPGPASDLQPCVSAVTVGRLG